MIFPEPTGRTAPKITGDGLNKMSCLEKSLIGLLCEAQAFPTPNMR